VSGVEEQLGGPGRLACAQLLLQRGMYVRCTNTYIYLVPETWDVSRFESVLGLLDHPVCQYRQILMQQNEQIILSIFSKE
jgi:hypothetical protein